MAHHIADDHRRAVLQGLLIAEVVVVVPTGLIAVVAVAHNIETRDLRIFGRQQ